MHKKKEFGIEKLHNNKEKKSFYFVYFIKMTFYDLVLQIWRWALDVYLLASWDNGLSNWNFYPFTLNQALKNQILQYLKSPLEAGFKQEATSHFKELNALILWKLKFVDY